MKYYLLTFNEDWADEHDVPALACMKEKDYNKWLKMPSGKLNPKYEEQQKVWQENQDKQNAFYAELQKRKLWEKQLNKYTKAEKEWYEANKIPYVSSYNTPRRCKSRLNAYLGNGGDSFDEGFSHLYLMQEFVDAGIVDVLEVDKSFHDTFHKAGLSSLSLCNVFDIKELAESDWDDDDDDEEE